MKVVSEYKKHKEFGKFTAEDYENLQRQKTEEAYSESSEEVEDGAELKIPDHFSSDKHNKLLPLNDSKNVTAYNFLHMMQKKDDELSISIEEFKEISFPNEWPKIMRDLCIALTGQDALQGNTIVEEDDGRKDMDQ